MTGTDLCVNKPQSVPVIFEPPCTNKFVLICVVNSCLSLKLYFVFIRHFAIESAEYGD